MSSSAPEAPLPEISWTPTGLGRRACGGPGIRVAVIGKRNHLHFDEHVAEAFVDAGHPVCHYQFNVRPLRHGLARAAARLMMRRRGAAMGDAWHAGAVSRELAQFRPALVFVVSVFFVPRVYLEALRSVIPAPVVVGWDGDALARFGSTHHYADVLDLVGVTEGSLVAPARKVFGRALYLPYAANPRVYRPLDPHRVDRAYFCGAHTPDREALLAGIAGVPMTVRGPGWERFAPAPDSFTMRPGKVSMAEQALDYARHLVVWNQHQKENNPDGSLNMRDFEAPASGAVLVSDHRTHMHEHFHVGDEVLMYREEGELQELLARCIDDPGASARMAARARARVLAHNTYRHRVEAVLGAL